MAGMLGSTVVICTESQQQDDFVTSDKLELKLRDADIHNLDEQSGGCRRRVIHRVY